MPRHRRAIRIAATGSAASTRMPRPPTRMSNAGTWGQIADHDPTTRSARFPCVRGAAAPAASRSDTANSPGRCTGPNSNRTGHTGLWCRTVFLR